MLTELFYSPVIYMNRGFFMPDILGVYTSRLLDTDEPEMALWAQKLSGAFPCALRSATA